MISIGDLALLDLAETYAIFFLASCLQGLTGFGFGMVTMALLPFLMSARSASILVAVLVLFNTGYLTWRQRAHVDWRIVGQLFVGSIVGVPLGVHILRVFPESGLKRLIGAGILLYSAYYTWQTFSQREPRKEWPKWTRLPIGFVAGILGGAVNVAGPPVILYFYSQPWDPNRIRALLVAYFFTLTAMKNVLMFAGGMVPTSTLLYVGILPLIWIGSRFGLYVGQRIEPFWFRRLVIVALTVLGLLLMRG